MAPKFAIVPVECAPDARFSETHYRVFIKLLNHMSSGQDKWCRVNQRKIGRAVGLTRETACRVISDFVEWGYIEKIKRGPGCLEYRVPKAREVGCVTDHTDVSVGNHNKNRLSLTTPPLPPKGGKFFKQSDRKELVQALRACCHLAAVDQLLVPLLESGQHLSPKLKDTAALQVLADLADGLAPDRLASALNNLLRDQRRLSSNHIRKEIERARNHGALLIFERDSPQALAWREHWRTINPLCQSFLDQQERIQVPEEWPPGYSPSEGYRSSSDRPRGE